MDFSSKFCRSTPTEQIGKCIKKTNSIFSNNIFRKAGVVSAAFFSRASYQKASALIAETKSNLKINRNPTLPSTRNEASVLAERTDFRFPASELKSKTAVLNDLAYDYLRKNDPQLMESEYDLPNLGVSQKWRLEEVKTSGKDILLVMRLVSSENDETGKVLHEPLAPEFQVFAAKKLDSKTYEIVRFEEVVFIPKSMVIRVASSDYETNEVKRGLSSYVVEVTGKGVIAALKSLRTGIRYFGFSGVVVPGGKASFDPTFRRSWRVLEANFDLMRGLSHEVGDIQAYQLDGDFEGYFKGGVPKKSSDGTQGIEVIPWAQSACIEVKP